MTNQPQEKPKPNIKQTPNNAPNSHDKKPDPIDKCKQNSYSLLSHDWPTQQFQTSKLHFHLDESSHYELCEACN